VKLQNQNSRPAVFFLAWKNGQNECAVPFADYERMNSVLEELNFWLLMVS